VATSIPKSHNSNRQESSHGAQGIKNGNTALPWLCAVFIMRQKGGP